MLAAQAIKAGDRAGRRRRRTGVDVERAVLHLWNARRREARRPDDGRRHDQGRPLVRVLRRPHGRPRRVHGEEGRRHARSSRTSSRRSRIAKAIAAIEAGKFKDEIVPVQIPGKKGPTTVDTDEGPRKDTTAESLAKLRPAFPSKDGTNDDLTVTAGNASSLNDGARGARRDVGGIRARAWPRRFSRASTRTRPARPSRRISSSRRFTPCRIS